MVDLRVKHKKTADTGHDTPVPLAEEAKVHMPSSISHSLLHTT